MNPESAGGFQPDGRQPQRLPGGPPRGTMGFDHRNIGPGGSMGSSMGVPALAIPRQGGMGSAAAPLAKGGFPSNEIVVFTAVCNKWPGKKYEQFYYPGSLMFVQRDDSAEGGRTTMNVISLAQLNEMLREGRQIIDSQLTNRPRSGMSIDGTPVNVTFAALKTHMQRYLEEGESYFTGNQKLSSDMSKTKINRKLICLSLKHIAEEFRYLGEYMSGENHGKPTTIINIGAQGPNDYQPLDNIWGEVTQGTRLWLILKAVENPDYVEGGSEPEYKYFQMIPRTGHVQPDPHELFYRDAAGVARYGVFQYIGEVKHEPLQHNEQTARNMMAGLTVNSREAWEVSRKNICKIVAVLGSPKAHVGWQSY